MQEPITLQEIQSIGLDILKTIKMVCDENNLRYYLFAGTLLGAVRHSGFIPWDDDIDIALPREDYDKLESICRLQLPEQYGWIDYKDDAKLPYHFAKVHDRRTLLVEEAREGYQVPLGVCLDVFPLDGVPRVRLRKLLHFIRVQALRAAVIINYVDNSKPRALWKRIVISLGQWVLTEPLVEAVHSRLEQAMRKYSYDSSPEVCSYFGSYGLREFFPKRWIGNGAMAEFEGIRMRIFEEYDKYLRRVYGDYSWLPPPEQRVSHHRFEAYYV